MRARVGQVEKKSDGDRGREKRPRVGGRDWRRRRRGPNGNHVSHGHQESITSLSVLPHMLVMIYLPPPIVVYPARCVFFLARRSSLFPSDAFRGPYR